MKSVSALWASPNTDATNNSGFAGLPGGYRYEGGFIYVGHSGLWWTSTESDDNYAWARFLYYDFPGAYRGFNFKEFGFGVRCLRDN